MKKLQIEWIEEDDDGLDPHWLEYTPEERFRQLEALRQSAFNFRDAALGTVTPRRMDRQNAKIEWIEEDDDGLDPHWLEYTPAELIRMERLYFLLKLERGLRESEAGQVMSHEEVKKHLGL
jgi:hypothetical protein